MSRRFEGKNIVVTGSNRGIGNEVLEVFVREGGNVFAVTRILDDEFAEYCKRMSQDYDVRVIPIQMDLAEDVSIKEGYKAIIKESRVIDVLINNAGVIRRQSVLAMTKMEQIRDVFQINFFSQVLLTQLISKNMIKEKRGSIVCVSSSAAFDGGANIEYSASKSAILGMVKRLSRELSVFNIRVNAVAPGLTETDMMDMLTEHEIEGAKRMSALHRAGTKREIANTILFLASEEASFINGQVVRVDGGM